MKLIMKKSITSSIQIIESIIKNRFILRRTFRDYRFIIIKISLIYQNYLYDFYFDIEYIISLIDRIFLMKLSRKKVFILRSKKFHQLKFIN